MNPDKRWILCVGFFLSLVSLSWGQVEPDVRPVYSSAGYPGADGLFLFANKTILWNEQGPLVEDIHHSFMAFTAQGVRKAGDFQFYLRLPEQQIQVVRAGTYRRESGFVSMAQADVTDDVLEEIGDENGKTEIRRRMLKLPRAGLNEISEVHIQRFTSGRPRGISGVEYLQSDEPMDQRTLRFVLPAGKTLRLNVHENGAGTLMSYRQGEAEVYTFQIRDVPAFETDDKGPPPDWTIRKLIYSSYENWAAASAALQVRISAALLRTSGLAGLVSRLTKDITGHSEKLERLYVYVSRELSHRDIPVRLRNYTFQSPEDVVRQGAGNGLDKAVLLAALIRALGWQAQPVLAGLDVQIDVPALEQMELTFVRAQLSDGRIVWMDPADKWSSPDWLPVPKPLTGLEIETEGVTVIEIDPVRLSQSRAELSCKVRMENDGSSEIVVSSVFNGYPARECRRIFSALSPENRKQALWAACQTVYPDAELGQVSMTGLQSLDCGQVRIDFTFVTSEFATRQGTWLVAPWSLLPLPHLSIVQLWEDPQRSAPLFIGLPTEYRWQTDLDFSPGVTVKYRPERREFSGDVLSTSMSCQETAGVNTIRLIKELKLLRAVVSDQEYPGLRREVRRIVAAEDHLLLLKVGPEAMNFESADK